MSTKEHRVLMLTAAADARSVIAFTVDNEGTGTAWDHCEKADFDGMRRILRNLLEDWDRRAQQRTK